MQIFSREQIFFRAMPTAMKVAVIVAVAATSQNALADSQEPPSVAAPPIVGRPANKPNNKLPAFTPEREAAALSFVAAQHPELAKVIEQLKTSRPEEYEAAVRELFAASERLSRIHEQDPRRYPLELEQWQLRSRIQLLVARAALSADPQFDEALREAVARQADLRVQMLELTRLQAAERLEKIDRDLEKARANRQREIDKQYSGLANGIKRARAAQAAGAAGSAKPPGKPAPQ